MQRVSISVTYDTNVRSLLHTSIRDRLSALGLGPKVNKLWEWDSLQKCFRGHKAVNQSKPLTDRSEQLFPPWLTVDGVSSK